MGLNDEDRKTMVGLEMEKADRFLKQAGMMCEMEQWDMAANRYYYACFHAVQALFIHNELADSIMMVGVTDGSSLYGLQETFRDKLLP